MKLRLLYDKASTAKVKSMKEKGVNYTDTSKEEEVEKKERETRHLSRLERVMNNGRKMETSRDGRRWEKTRRKLTGLL